VEAADGGGLFWSKKCQFVCVLTKCLLLYDDDDVVVLRDPSSVSKFQAQQIRHVVNIGPRFFSYVKSISIPSSVMSPNNNKKK
jgi:hypothetical protein